VKGLKALTPARTKSPPLASSILIGVSRAGIMQEDTEGLVWSEKWGRPGEGSGPPQKKMNYSPEMARFGEFRAVFLLIWFKLGRTISIGVSTPNSGDTPPVIFAYGIS